MTTTEITPQLKLTIVKHLAGGKDADLVATIVSLPRDRVVDIASNHGYPDTDKMARAAELMAAKIDRDASTLPAARPQPVGARPQTAGAATSTPAVPAPSPLTRPDEIRVLLNTAKAHPSKRIQKAADRVFDDLDKLKALLREDEEKHAERRKAEQEKAAARAEVARLQEQLREARAKLRGTTATPSGASTSDGGPSAADIRSWAAEQGIDCPTRGRIPAEIRDSYDAAHTDETAIAS